MGPSDIDPPDDRMLIVRHECLDEGPLRRERFWLGDIDADLLDVDPADVAAAIEVRVDRDGARLSSPEPGRADVDPLARRLVGVVLRELVGRGVVRIMTDVPAGDCVAGELTHLGFTQLDDATTWEAGGAG